MNKLITAKEARQRLSNYTVINNIRLNKSDKRLLNKSIEEINKIISFESLEKREAHFSSWFFFEDADDPTAIFDNLLLMLIDAHYHITVTEFTDFSQVIIKW